MQTNEVALLIPFDDDFSYQVFWETRILIHKAIIRESG